MITCYKPEDFSRLTHSLSRFCGMSRREALVFANDCARANYEAFCSFKSEKMEDSMKVPFPSLFQEEGKPYLTEVQLYKSMKALISNAGGSTDKQREAASHLQALCNDLNDHCWDSYGLDIEDERTVYAFCESSLNPSAEPACVLWEDWRGLICS